MVMKMKNNYALVDAVKKLMPAGTRIELLDMKDPNSLPIGSLGTVDFIDDAGQIHMNWDCGSTLALIPNVDDFRIIPDENGTKYVIMRYKYRSPLYFAGWENREIKTTKNINEALLFDDSGSVEDEYLNIHDAKYEIYPVCPRCHRHYENCSAISRYDNKTKICEMCGLTEGLWEFFRYEKKATNK